MASCAIEFCLFIAFGSYPHNHNLDLVVLKEISLVETREPILQSQLKLNTSLGGAKATGAAEACSANLRLFDVSIARISS